MAAKSRFIGNIALDTGPQTMLERIVTGPVEIVMTVVVVLNALILAASFQYSGLDVGEKLGLVSSAEIWVGHARLFHLIEHAFQAFYTAELCLRLMYYRTRFFYDDDFRRLEKLNLFDVLIVLSGCVELYLLPLFDVSTTKVTFLRVIR